ncbi:MAG: Flagellar biosynthetic protein FliR [Chlamydiales bacterium]|nr:Flagellar biosynthetic protein FliR [Chlamydiales bacterium]
MSSELYLCAALFSRLVGFFLLSPLFSQRGIPLWVRLGAALSCTLLLTPPLIQQTISITHPFLFAAGLLKELAIGYLLGFLFSLLFEAAAFAGQVVGTLTGFSATELLDPLSNSRHPLLARLFSLTLFALFLALDLHHPLLRVLYDSYANLSPNLAFNVINATTRLFHHALAYAFFPLSVLLTLFLCFAILSRFFPNLQIFWTGFPIQILIGFGTIACTIGFFGQILQAAFHEMWSIALKILFPL